MRVTVPWTPAMPAGWQTTLHRRVGLNILLSVTSLRYNVVTALHEIHGCQNRILHVVIDLYSVYKLLVAIL